jgi:hypothetical protein
MNNKRKMKKKNSCRAAASKKRLAQSLVCPPKRKGKIIIQVDLRKSISSPNPYSMDTRN